MSDSGSSLLSPTRILPSMTPPISLTITTTPSWPLCDISLSWQCLHSREWYPLSISVIPHIWASFGLLIKTVILLMLHSTPFALWTSSQWNRICEWSVTVLSTTNKRIISLSLTCQRNTTCNLCCFQTTLKYHFPAHSLCFLDIIIPPNQHHSPEYPIPSCIDIIIISPICNWNSIMALSSSFHQHSLFPFHMISNPLIQTHSHSQPLKHTPTASILATLCNPWFQ